MKYGKIGNMYTVMYTVMYTDDTYFQDNLAQIRQIYSRIQKYINVGRNSEMGTRSE